MASIEFMLGLAFGAGIITFFNPCSYAMLPAYISYTLGKGGDGSKKLAIRAALDGAGFGVAATIGFFSVFLAIGALVSLFGEMRFLYPWLQTIVGVIMALLGISWLAGINFRLPIKPKYRPRASPASFYFFGIAYALAAVACALPVFLSVLTMAFASQGFIFGLMIFLAYATGMGMMMILTSAAAMLSRELLVRHLSLMSHIHKISALVLILAGIYLILY